MCKTYLASNGFDGKVEFEWSPDVLVTMCGVGKSGW